MRDTYIDFDHKHKEELSFEKYRKLDDTDKSMIEDVEIRISDPLDMEDFGGVIVTYKKKRWDWRDNPYTHS